MRNLKSKINSIKSGYNITERKKNPFDTSVHPALFFRKPPGKRKPVDYSEISNRPLIGNHRMLVHATSVKHIPKPQFTPRSLYQSPRQIPSLAIALDSMDAEMYFDENYNQPRQPSVRGNHIGTPYQWHNEYEF